MKNKDLKIWGIFQIVGFSLLSAARKSHFQKTSSGEEKRKTQHFWRVCNCVCAVLSFMQHQFCEFCTFCLWSSELCEGGLLHPDILHFSQNNTLLWESGRLILFFWFFLETSQISRWPLLGSKWNQTSSIFLLFSCFLLQTTQHVPQHKTQTSADRKKQQHSTCSTYKCHLAPFSFLFF